MTGSECVGFASGHSEIQVSNSLDHNQSTRSRNLEVTPAESRVAAWQRLPTDEGQGIVVGEVLVGHRKPLKEIGKGFWRTREDDLESIDWWYDGYGRDY